MGRSLHDEFGKAYELDDGPIDWPVALTWAGLLLVSGVCWGLAFYWLMW